MQENLKTIEINNEKDLAKINSENIHCVYLGDDCVHYRAFSLENENIVCYEVSDKVNEELAREKLSEIFYTYSYPEHYFGMGHSVRMREEYYVPFKRRIKNIFVGFKAIYWFLAIFIETLLKSVKKFNALDLKTFCFSLMVLLSLYLLPFNKFLTLSRLTSFFAKFR